MNEKWGYRCKDYNACIFSVLRRNWLCLRFIFLQYCLRSICHSWFFLMWTTLSAYAASYGMAPDNYSFLAKNRDHHEIIINRFRELPWWFVITGDTHYGDVIIGAIASQITSLAIVYSTVYSDADQRKHQSSASLAFVRGIHRDRWIPHTKGR